MLSVVIDGPSNFVTRFTEDRSRGLVVLSSDLGKAGNFVAAIDELSSMDARHKALGFANANGVGDARINGSPGSPYPVNSEGLPLDQVKGEAGEPLNMRHPRMQVERYRVDIPVTRRLV